MTEIITLPVTRNFDDRDTITLDVTKLPGAPEFVFSIGFRCMESCKTPAGEIPTEQYTGKYDLRCVSLVSDQSYVGYLKQVGKL